MSPGAKKTLKLNDWRQTAKYIPLDWDQIVNFNKSIQQAIEEACCDPMRLELAKVKEAANKRWDEARRRQ